MNQDEKFMKEAYLEALKARRKGEVPVGCVITRSGKIIARAHNRKEKKHNVLCHAEIIAINKVCRKLKRWILDDCEIYVTIEPCMMCAGAVLQARFKSLVYGIEQTNPDVIHVFRDYERSVPQVRRGCLAQDIKTLMQEFFCAVRKNK